MKINKEILKGSTETLILKVLETEPLYGYQISKRLQEKSRRIFSLGEGTLYPLLHKLEKEKLLESYWQEYSGRRRKYYQLTTRGKKILTAKTAEWKVFAGAMRAVINK